MYGEKAIILFSLHRITAVTGQNVRNTSNLYMLGIFVEKQVYSS